MTSGRFAISSVKAVKYPSKISFASVFFLLNSLTSASILCFNTFNLLSISFFNNLSSFLKECLVSFILKDASLNSLYILSFVSFKSEITLSVTTFCSKSFLSRSSVKWRRSSSNLSLRSLIWSLTLLKSSSITPKVLPIQEKSGTWLTSLTHFGNTGIDSFTARMSSLRDSKSAS